MDIKQLEYDETNFKKYIEKPVGLYSKIEKSNRIINSCAKINKIINVSEDYETNLKETNSHTESTIITGSEFVSSKTIQSASFAVAAEIGLEISAVGGFTPISCAVGALGASLIYLTGLEMAEQTKQITNHVVKNTIQTVKQIKNELPESIKNIIYECISEPVEQTLKFTYNFGIQTINKVKQTVSSVICENWEKINPNGTIIYCEDLEQNKIEITLDKKISTKIYNYCKISDNNYQIPYYSYYPLILDDFIGTKTQTFESRYNKFEEKINSFEYQLENYDFASRVTKHTPYEQLVLDLPKPNSRLITRHHINPNTIPDYRVQVNISGSGSGGGGGGLTAVGCVVAIAIKVSFLF